MKYPPINEAEALDIRNNLLVVMPLEEVARHYTRMMTSSNGNLFRVTGPMCGEFTGPGEFPTQRPVTRSFDVPFDLRLNKRLSKQPWGWWFETLSWSLWRHCNGTMMSLRLLLTCWRKRDAAGKFSIGNAMSLIWAYGQSHLRLVCIISFRLINYLWYYTSLIFFLWN